MTRTATHPALHANASELVAKTVKELATVKVKGFISLYNLTAEFIEKGYILDHNGLALKLDITLSNLRCCNPDGFVPADLHAMCIATDIATEEALQAALR